MLPNGSAERGMSARDGGEVRGAHVELVVILEQQRPIGRVQLGSLVLRLHRESLSVFRRFRLRFALAFCRGRRTSAATLQVSTSALPWPIVAEFLMSVRTRVPLNKYERLVLGSAAVRHPIMTKMSIFPLSKI